MSGAVPILRTAVRLLPSCWDRGTTSGGSARGGPPRSACVRRRPATPLRLAGWRPTPEGQQGRSRHSPTQSSRLERWWRRPNGGAPFADGSLRFVRTAPKQPQFRLDADPRQSTGGFHARDVKGPEKGAESGGRLCVFEQRGKRPRRPGSGGCALRGCYQCACFPIRCKPHQVFPQTVCQLHWHCSVSQVQAM